jgi:DNA repair protein RadC
VQASAEILAETGGLVDVSEMGGDELMAIPGFGKARVATLVAAVEQGRRMSSATLKGSPRLDDIRSRRQRAGSGCCRQKVSRTFYRGTRSLLLRMNAPTGAHMIQSSWLERQAPWSKLLI